MTWLVPALAILLVATVPAGAALDTIARPATEEPWPTSSAAILPVPISPIPPTDDGFAPSEVLDLAAERYERLTVLVTIMGEGPFRFIVDTGAQASVISRTLADQLQLFDRRPATLVGLNSSRPIETAAIPSLSLGSRNFPIAQAALVEGEYIGAADGILGLDSLQHQRVLLDFRDNSITVADAEGSGRSGYEIVVRARRRLGQLIIAQAQIDGVRTAIIIDTGAQGSVGNLELLRRLRGLRDLGGGEMIDINGIANAGSVRIARVLEIESARLENLPINFVDSPTFGALGLEGQPALLLGMSELRLFNRVAIDFNRREILFDVPRPGDRRRPGSGASE